ncbi:MAG TPA: hypothetical protein VMS16_06510, partial [Mycobacterium sp.]|nr:hypothetical protein [Mycobacterium sp.]
MLNSTLGATHDATVGNDNLSQPTVLVTEPQAPALITEQEVMLGTAFREQRKAPGHPKARVVDYLSSEYLGPARCAAANYRRGFQTTKAV